jgi:hypothetical protein
MTLLLVCPDPTERAEVAALVERLGLDVLLVDAVPRALDTGPMRAIEEAIAAHLPEPEPLDFGPLAPLHAPERDRTDRRVRRDPSGRRERRDYVERSRRP